MTEMDSCPVCKQKNIYFDGSLFICPDCGHECSQEEQQNANAANIARDSNGSELQNGDSVIVIKSLDVKGSSMVIKRGTKVKSIRLTDNSEEIEGKIDGSNIVLKTCFLKKTEK